MRKASRQFHSAVLSLSILALGGGALAETPALDRLEVEPTQVVLRNADESTQVLATLQLADGTRLDMTRSAAFTSSNPAVARVENGRVVPTGDGEAHIDVVATEPASGREFKQSVPVVVRGFAVNRTLNFTNDIVPVLTKFGCNAGGCHGKASGQNGFRLSLLGFDPAGDHDALVKEGRGRRIFPPAPERSLLLTKPTGQSPHGGGRKFDRESPAYKMLLRWVAQGAPFGKSDDPTVARIAVVQPVPTMGRASRQQLRIVAHYTDGSTKDVTREAEYKSQQPDILTVDSAGLVTTLDSTGEGTVMVRYMGQVDVARVSVPFGKTPPDSAYAHFRPNGFIDELVLQKWKRLGLAPSALCTDEEFIRRAALDAIGTLPTPDEVRQFLADSSPQKRDQLVDRLLERNEYASYWANQWGDLLRNKRRYGDGYKRGTFAFAAWIRDAFVKNVPYDQFVREILTAQGDVSDTPPVVWYREVRNVTHQVNDTSQLFLGTRIQCANCHHHPYEKWSQDDYWGFAAHFARLGQKQGAVANENAIFVRKDGGMNQPRTGRSMKPKPLGAPEAEFVRGEDPRQRLVDWMVAPENPYFAKSIANRMWAHFMGVGLVEAVDDMRVTNPPSNPALLDALAKDFVAHKFDLKHLVRTIMKAQTYQLSAAPTANNAKDRQNYARYFPRRLAAETLSDAVDAVTGSTERFGGFPAGTRAIDLPDEAISSYFLDVFGRSQRETACECERSKAPNLAQVLHLMNSPETQNKIANGRVGQLIKDGKKDDEIARELFLWAFSRMPRPDELEAVLGYAPSKSDQARKGAFEDVLWSLLSSKEFLFNH
ncbi:MAG: DUF1549 domain-containing protein [Isosphaeraceae bacterium]|nr:DUF1549 domain-containing protein [Isosphaeraceae bacterium]